MSVLNVKKLHPEAKIPIRAHESDAGLDIYSIESVIVKQGERVAIKTGLAMAVPIGFVGLIWDKSGLSLKNGIKVMGGVIDAEYRGEIQVILINLGQEDYLIEQGSKIAQILIQKVELCTIEEVTNLEETVRGASGFGSTGNF